MKQQLFSAAMLLSLSIIVPSGKLVNTALPFSSAYSYTVPNTSGEPEKKLEETAAVYQLMKGKTSTAQLNIAGGKSAIRLRVGAGEFRAHPNAGVEPVAAEQINLYKINTDKKTRSISLDPTGIISATKINISVVHIDSQTINISITGGIISPGEYAFVEKSMAASNSTLTVWCFGVD